MSEGDATAWLGGWKSYRVEKIEHVEGGRPAVWITLAGLPGRPMICEGCGQPVAQVYESTIRTVRDRPSWMPRLGCWCPAAGLPARVAAPGWSGWIGWADIHG